MSQIIPPTQEFQQFLENYKGIIDPHIAFAEAKAKAEVAAGMFKNATYNQSYNRQLEREHIASARIRAGARY